MSSSQIFALRKQGQVQQALDMARAEYGEGSSDLWLLRAYGWVLYDHAKQVVNSYETKALSPTRMSSQLSSYMREFARMGNTLRGDAIFSQMLRLAGKASKEWQEFLRFARWAGVVDFSEEDKTPFITEEGKTLDSLQTRLIRAICRETVSKVGNADIRQDLIEWGLNILDDALRDSPNDPWLNYYQSKLHLTRGQVDDAISRLAPVLRRQAKVAWPWSLLGEILEASRPDDAIACYGQATQLAREEQEVAKTRIHLAHLLAQAKRFAEAAHQVKLSLAFREQQQFKVPQELAQMAASDWYRGCVADARFQRLPDAGAAAVAILDKINQQNIKYQQGVVDHINMEKGGSYVATAPDGGFFLSHRKFRDVAAVPPGTIVEVGVAAGDNRPAYWRPAFVITIPGLCEALTGQLDRPEGKNFAFIRTEKASVFVPPNLAADVPFDEVTPVRCLAVWRTDKEGKTRWKALAWLPSDFPATLRPLP